MTTHIALEEGHDIEDVAQWGVRRKLFHAQMLGAYHEHRNEQMEKGRAGYDDVGDTTGFDPDDLMDDLPQTAQQPTGTSAAANGDVDPRNPVGRREHAWDLPDEDVDWQFCEQCQGLFEPGEYEQHFEMTNFTCTA